MKVIAKAVKAVSGVVTLSKAVLNRLCVVGTRHFGTALCLISKADFPKDFAFGQPLTQATKLRTPFNPSIACGLHASGTPTGVFWIDAFQVLAKHQNTMITDTVANHIAKRRLQLVKLNIVQDGTEKQITALVHGEWKAGENLPLYNATADIPAGRIELKSLGFNKQLVWRAREVKAEKASAKAEKAKAETKLLKAADKAFKATVPNTPANARKLLAKASK